MGHDEGACSHNKIGRETTIDCPISNHWLGVAYGLVSDD